MMKAWSHLRFVVACAAALPACGEVPFLCMEGGVRQESQSCCSELGIDACGAGLVCAALDERKQPTCYREYSRHDLSECSVDRLCASGTCNQDTRRCQSSYLAACDPDTGCAPDPRGYTLDCGEVQPQYPACHRVGVPYEGPCNYNLECASNDCSCNRGERTCCNP